MTEKLFDNCYLIRLVVIANVKSVFNRKIMSYLLKKILIEYNGLSKEIFSKVNNHNLFKLCEIFSGIIIFGIKRFVIFFLVTNSHLVYKQDKMYKLIKLYQLG